MTVAELITLLQTMPPDALVIQTMCSDYHDLEPADVTLIGPDKRLIRHHGHLMHLEEKWWPLSYGEKPARSEYLTAVHFAGN